MHPHDTPIAIYKRIDAALALVRAGQQGFHMGIGGEQRFELVGVGVHAAVFANLARPADTTFLIAIHAYPTGASGTFRLHKPYTRALTPSGKPTKSA